MTEYVYCLKNESMPGLLKIGRTTGSIKKRANQLSKDTGVPSPFIPIMKIKTSDCTFLEKSIHSHLKPYRNAPKKEFFKISEEELYTKLTEEMNLTVTRINDSDYSSSSDDDDDSGSRSHLQKNFKKMHKQLECCSHSLELLFDTAAKDSKYDLIRPRPTTDGYCKKKYHENGHPYLVNKLYDYDISGCGQSSTSEYEYAVFKLRQLRDDTYQREIELGCGNSKRKEYLEKLTDLHNQKKEYINEQKNCQNEDDLNLYTKWVENIEKRIKDLKEDQRIWNDDNKEWIKIVEKMLTDVKEVKEMFEERSKWCDLRNDVMV
jgi:hypothetical protein